MIHDNTWANNGKMPRDTLTLPMVTPLEDIVWDGRADAMKDNTDALNSSLRPAWIPASEWLEKIR